MLTTFSIKTGYAILANNVLIKQLIKSDDLKDKEQERNKSIVARALFNQNVVGQDSITHFDYKGSKHKKKLNNKNIDLHY